MYEKRPEYLVGGRNELEGGFSYGSLLRIVSLWRDLLEEIGGIGGRSNFEVQSSISVRTTHIHNLDSALSPTIPQESAIPGALSFIRSAPMISGLQSRAQ